MNLCGEFLAHALSATRCLQTSGFRGLGRISAQAPSYHSQRDLILESSLHTPLCHQCINTTAFAVQRKVISTHTTSTLQCQYKILCSVSTRRLQYQYKPLVAPVQDACSASTSCCVLMFAPNICKLVRKTIIPKLILFDYNAAYKQRPVGAISVGWPINVHSHIKNLMNSKA